ncbi:MAG: hypothetical protein LC790_21040, partial [Actinobacteria bacterium]|nr:hypothetical protein [Actinomycetota bacterium]
PRHAARLDLMRSAFELAAVGGDAQDDWGYSQDKAEKSISWLDWLAANCGSSLVGVVAERVASAA